MKRIVVLLALALSLAASAQTMQPEGYRVTAYNSQTHEWTIIRTGTFDGEFQKKKIVVLCQWFEDENGRRTDGPDACSLRVGQFMKHDLSRIAALKSGKPWLANIATVMELDDTLLVSEGSVHPTTSQVFRVKKIELVQP